MSAARREKTLATLPFWSPPALAPRRDHIVTAPQSTP
jgi:hypothetical protein